MGLYDGQIGGDGLRLHRPRRRGHRDARSCWSSTSRTRPARSPRSCTGMVAFDPSVRIAGVILNKAGSQRHADEVCRALEPTGLPVLGVLHRDDGIVAPSRHLGLVPAAERDDAAHALDRLADRIAAGRRPGADRRARPRPAPDLDAQPWDPHGDVARRRARRRPVVAVAGGRAFTFRYAETDELLRSGRLRGRHVRPAHRRALPEGTAGLYLGGGFPEVHAAGLSANAPLRAALLDAVTRWHADGRRVRGAALPLPQRRRRPDGRRDRRRGSR